jgi:hypothetical protein
MHSRNFVPSGATQGALVQTAEVNFICPQCSSLYEVVKAKTPQDKNEPPYNAQPARDRFLPAKPSSRSSTFSGARPTGDGIARLSAFSLRGFQRSRLIDECHGCDEADWPSRRRRDF